VYKSIISMCVFCSFAYFQRAQCCTIKETLLVAVARCFPFFFAIFIVVVVVVVFERKNKRKEKPTDKNVATVDSLRDKIRNSKRDVLREGNVARKRHFGGGEPRPKTLPLFNHGPVIVKSVKVPRAAVCEN
jgi:hypothetical protein